MSRPVGMAVVGAGSIGIRGALEHLTIRDVHDRVTLAAVCDPVEGRAQAAAEKYGAAKVYESYKALLADPTVDAITLCTPIGLHFEQGLQAIRAGKHIHFNKTMTTTKDEAQQLIAEAKQHKVKLVASPGQMIRPVNRAIRRMIQDGELGRLAWATTGAAFGDYHEQEGVRQGNDVLSNINPAWYWRKPGGGPLYDMTVYGLHTLTGVLGAAKRVTAMSGAVIRERTFKGETYTSDCDDNTLMVLDFGDTVFSFVYGTLTGGVAEFGQPSFFGTKGTIIGTKLDGKAIEVPTEEKSMHPFGPHVVGAHADMGESHVFEDIMQLVDLVREDIPTVATAEHACHVIEIIEAAYRAAKTGQTQTLTTTF
jgi:predicted dehydrogenase